MSPNPAIQKNRDLLGQKHRATVLTNLDRCRGQEKFLIALLHLHQGVYIFIYSDHKKEWKVEKRGLIDIKYKVLEGAIKN